MAKRMSLIFLMFMIVPMIAPAVGAGITAFTSWRAIFMLFAVMAALMLVWLRRLPETLAPADVRPLDWRPMLAGWGTRAEERRGGKAGGRPGRTRGSPGH